MKKIIYLFLAIIVFGTNLKAETGLGLVLGLATPNDKINDVYNSSKLNNTIWREGSKSGYNLGLKLRVPLTEDFTLIGSASWNRFPETEMNIGIPKSDPTITKLDTIVLTTTQNVFPLTAGFNYYLINSFMGLYGTGELSYNFISSTVNYKKNDVAIPLNLDTAPMDSRVGVGLGLGADIDAKLVLLNLEAKYNISNLIGKSGDEPTKSYFTLTLGVFFGGAAKQKK